MVRATIQERFERFHTRHPEVYAELVKLTRLMKARGRTRLGISSLWEVMRWEMVIRRDQDEFKLNNNYRSRYARLIMEREPDLDGIFETRTLVSE